MDSTRCVVLLATTAVVFLSSSQVQAAPCAGFSDVDNASAFCPNVEWIKNRSITFGCSSATVYCPDASVNRLQMAAFLNRLGTAMTPVQMRVDLVSGTVDLDVSPVVCQTGDFAVVDFPRRAYLDVAMSVSATADVEFAADLAYSLNAGGTWTNLNINANRGSVIANQWSGASDIGFQDLNVGETVRWGMRMSRGGTPGTQDLADSRCQLRALIQSRDGSTSPF